MNAAHAREPWEGRVVEGKYPLLELLGSGPRGSVFRTEVSGKNAPQKAAIKIIPVEQASVDDQLYRLRLATQLSNPHLIKIFEAGQCQIQRGPAIYVVMEFAEENLGQVLPSRALTANEARQMLPPLLEALSYLHSQGLVHGHVQPSNILAVGDRLKLSTDCVRPVGSTDKLQGGKSGYAAPEAAKNTPASDVWSLGAILVAALATESRGQPSEQELTMVPSSIPEPFRRIARECLHANPSDRCTLEQIKIWLDLNQQPTPVVEPSTPRQSRGLGLKVTVGVAAILAAFFGWRLIRSTPSGSPNETTQSSTQSAPASPATATQQGSVPGAVTERALPNVSQGARNTIQGKIRVAVRVNVDATGSVTDAKLTSPGPSKYFANQALQSARRWKFKPPQTDGQPIASAWLLKYQFGRAGTEVSPAPVR
jgi:TonB family protein